MYGADFRFLGLRAAFDGYRLAPPGSGLALTPSPPGSWLSYRSDAVLGKPRARILGFCGFRGVTGVGSVAKHRRFLLQPGGLRTQLLGLLFEVGRSARRVGGRVHKRAVVSA